MTGGYTGSRDVWAWGRPLGNEPDEKRSGDKIDPHFRSDAFLDAYLNPESEVGCQAHRQVDCLCDVDVSRTEGYSWDKLPKELAGVQTGEDFILAAANIWLNQDLLGLRREVREGTIVSAESGGLGQALELVRKGATFTEVSKVAPINDREYTLLRMALGVSRVNKQHTPPLPRDEVEAMLSEGLSNSEIINHLFLQTGVKHSQGSLSHLKNRLRLRAIEEKRATGGRVRGQSRSYDYERVWAMKDSGLDYDQIAATLEAEGKPHNRNTIRNICLRARARGE